MIIHYMTDSHYNLGKLSDDVDKAGYYSMLLVYHSTQPDAWIKCAHALNKKHKFKYMIAMRPYAISPEYFSMMCNAFNELSPNRIMFNIVAGDLQKEEKSVEHALFIGDLIDTSEKRIEYTAEWIKKLKKINKIWPFPEIVMSGFSEKTLDTASEFADYNLCMIDTYKEHTERFSKNKKRMVSAQIVIRNKYEEAKDFVETNIPEKHKLRWTIFGTESDIIKEFEYLESIGVTDIMLRTNNKDNMVNLVHDFVRKYNSREMV